MKKRKIAISVILIVGLLLSGCAGAAFTISSAGNRSTIEANNAPDGATAQSGSFSVGKGKTACVESSLEKGKLKIDFARATVTIEHETERRRRDGRARRQPGTASAAGRLCHARNRRRQYERKGNGPL